MTSQNITLASLKESSSQKLKQIDFMAWLNESRSLLPQVYVEGHKLDDAYMQKNKGVIETQLKDGAVLLAACLEKVLGQVTNIPAGPVTSAPPASQQPAKPGKAIVSTGTITPDQAATHISETVTVCGKVFGTKLLSNGPTFLNMGGEYPDNPFTAVIMFDKRGNFSYKPEEFLQGKTICVTGLVKNYKGKPEIVVNKEERVKVQ